jgi:diaminohydroxyphosphoribosylaminopyrimidine deaminase/5-amino-6-(5-phosphoribosylamino)uracil reductase
MDKLAERKVNEVLLETGATLSGAMLEARLVDEMVIYMAPLLLGDSARGLYRLPHLQQMADRIELDIRETRVVGKDLRITAIPIYKGVD